MYITVLSNTLILGFGYYLSIVFLPEIMGVNPLIPKYLLISLGTSWLVSSKNKWWINMISILLAIMISFPVVDGLLK
ncbi:hypothetical protein DC421_24105 [Priestia megaterium]|nr:hypothetical protein DC428_23515 [Priestia megaterium]PVE79868.1 hypothetical protein DC421_24105 [Priestia megaterium]PVE83775.1 hypothetical protein DC426_20210 [Priestia megaterium]PVE99547.1 hypothetical protein DC433_13040 [Priestia megaterium]